MENAKIIYPIITIGKNPYFGSIYFLCPKDCIFDKDCVPKKNYEKVEEDIPEIVYELIQDNRKNEVMAEFEKHKKARIGSIIECPSGDHMFKITKDLTKINGSGLGEPFKKYEEFLMRKCVTVEPTF